MVLDAQSFCVFFTLLLLSLISCAEEIYDITPSRPLAQGQTLISAGNVFELGFFNNSANKYVGIWHKDILPRKVVWVANREKPIAATDTSAGLTISSNGSLEIVDGKQNSVWSTNFSGTASSLNNGSAAVAVLLDDGNLVVKFNVGVAADQYLWESFDYPSDTLQPQMLMGFDSVSGTRNSLTSWKSENDPSTGMFLAGLSHEEPSQLVVWINGSTPYWRSGPWDKSKFIGVPEMDDQYRSGFNLQDNKQQGTKHFSFDLFAKTIAAFMDISSEGVLRLIYSKHGENWNTFWEAPAAKNPCDNYGACGPFGVCKASGSPICKCLKGFVPKSREEWSRGNRAGGCVRQTKLFCESNTSQSVASRGNGDGFTKMSSVKLPDFHEFISSLDAEKCKIQCLNNCSCLAYAYVNNIGCLVWPKDLIDIQEFSSGGEDLFIRLRHTKSGQGKRTRIIASLSAICFIGVLVAIVFVFCRLQAKRRVTKSGNIKVTKKFVELTDPNENSSDSTLQEYIREHEQSDLFIYRFDSVSIATNNFSITNKLGEGGFGPVYKGKLKEGKEIAVKRLSSNSGQGVEEFKNEVLLISKLQHKNLVRIMGCCVKDDEKLLVYEFMPNGSLDTILFNPNRRAELDWARRFNVIQGVARGLLYLHHDSRLKVIHRDLKVSNILLDENMNPKISDFGLARIVQGTQKLENTQKVVGTLGYMAPEYAMGGILSEKSDVYSFGVLLLEIVSGTKNTSFYYHEKQLGFLAYSWHLWNEGRGLDLVDEVLGDSYPSSQAMRCVHIGLLCIQDNATDRPTMPDVVLMLSSETDRPQPQRPIFTFQKSVSNPQSQKDSIYSANVDTITTIEGR
ncbi:G-type lectin S-receptor-like serine/threonine-protein kinase At1g61490 [Malus sylvestris]|uniref:G-type lectin S-receptor-like serine/threonine-protein kinase At1g61490 n=1 Tax=Malus sylvestris TaxID=3752 RepID=UPI0021ABE2E5|nr:G-type lectin S-receptor-like serine/threonine-protein kinase At1g61490 [Malus sylvestris]